MKLKIDRAPLSRELRLVASIAERRSTIPALTHILLTAKDDNALRTAKLALGLPRNGSHGIYAPAVHPAARLAFSMLRRLENREDDLHHAMDAEADEKWCAEHGEPWYGRPVRANATTPTNVARKETP